LRSGQKTDRNEHQLTSPGCGSLPATELAEQGEHQTWVDDSGLLLVLEGHWDGQSMHLEGVAAGADGALTKQLITWSPNPDGSVRELWEAADGKGAWVVVFDGRYTEHYARKRSRSKGCAVSDCTSTDTLDGVTMSNYVKPFPAVGRTTSAGSPSWLAAITGSITNAS
jgi:hypothetical protein